MMVTTRTALMCGAAKGGPARPAMPAAGPCPARELRAAPRPSHALPLRQPLPRRPGQGQCVLTLILVLVSALLPLEVCADLCLCHSLGLCPGRCLLGAVFIDLGLGHGHGPDLRLCIGMCLGIGLSTAVLVLLLVMALIVILVRLSSSSFSRSVRACIAQRSWCSCFDTFICLSV